MTIVPRITCANLRKSSRPSASVTAIGVKGQRNNNNRGGGRRPGFEARCDTLYMECIDAETWAKLEQPEYAVHSPCVCTFNNAM